MQSDTAEVTPVVFQRKTLVLEPFNNARPGSSLRARLAGSSEEVSEFSEPCTALVINASFSMAKEITLALTLRMPNCSIMYAPSLGLARWILLRRKVNLVVSSALLPDGNVSELTSIFERMEEAPDLVVVGHLNKERNQEMERSGYLISSIRHLGEAEEAEFSPVSSENESLTVHSRVSELGADIRNDLNNPLQEIVAMVFVAQAADQAGPATIQALDAIERAANGMANVVKSLEDKIRLAVDQPAGP